MSGRRGSGTTSWVPWPARAGVGWSVPADEAGTPALRSTTPIMIRRSVCVGSPPIVLRLLRGRPFRRSTLRVLAPVQGDRHTYEAGSCNHPEQEGAGQRVEAFGSDPESGRPFGDIAGGIDGSELERMGSIGEVERQRIRCPERRKSPTVDAHLESCDSRTTIRRAPRDRHVTGGGNARRIETDDVWRHGIHADGK